MSAFYDEKKTRLLIPSPPPVLTTLMPFLLPPRAARDIMAAIRAGHLIYFQMIRFSWGSLCVMTTLRIVLAFLLRPSHIPSLLSECLKTGFVPEKQLIVAERGRIPSGHPVVRPCSVLHSRRRRRRQQLRLSFHRLSLHLTLRRVRSLFL